MSCVSEIASYGVLDGQMLNPDVYNVNFKVLHFSVSEFILISVG